MSNATLHVVPHNGTWAVERWPERGGNDTEVLSTHSSRIEAIDAAKRQEEDDVVIHDDTKAVPARHAVAGRSGALFPEVTWGTIFVGLFLVMAAQWLLYLFGASIGVSVLDATDAAALGSGLSVWAIIWLVLSTIGAFFVGPLLACRLIGLRDRFVGIVHGITIWAVASTVMAVIGYMGIATVVKAGFAGLKTTAAAASTLTSDVASGVVNTAEATGNMTMALANELSNSPLVDEVQASLKDQAATMVANVPNSHVTTREARRAITRLDDRDVERITGQLIAGETEQAQRTLADATNLTRAETRQMIDAVSRDLQRQIDAAHNNKSLVEDVQTRVGNELQASVADVIASADTPGGTEVTDTEVERALNDADPRMVRRAAMQLIQGHTDKAESILVANTRLTRDEVDALVSGVNQRAENVYAEFKSTVNDYAEGVTDYTETTLWTAFVMAAAGLAASLFGGWLGVKTVPLA